MIEEQKDNNQQKSFKSEEELKSLRERLYRPGAEFEERTKSPEEFKLGQEKEKEQSGKWAEFQRKRLTEEQINKIKRIGYIAGAVFVVGVIALTIYGFLSFSKKDVVFEVLGPEKIVSAEGATYFVRYKNNTHSTLKNIKLVFRYPDKSIPIDSTSLEETIELPDLKGGQENQLELPVRILGAKDQVKTAFAELSYQAGGLSSRFAHQAEFSTTIISTPLILTLDLPENLSNNQSFEFSVRIENQSEITFNDLELQLDYPSGFNFQSAAPSPKSENRIWTINNLLPSQEKEVHINAIMTGETREVKPFKAKLGLLEDSRFLLLSEKSNAVQIAYSPLWISQKVNNSTEYTASAGEHLNFKIYYENTTDYSIKNAVINSRLEGKALDFATLNLNKGSYESSSQTIVWKASNLPQLAYIGPHEKGETGFSVQIKKPLPVNNFTDKNFVISNTATIDSSEKPEGLKDINIAGETKLSFKVNSELNFQAQGYYYDDTMSNTGPIPPKVGQTTTYTLKWRVVNSSNDLERTRIEAFLPPHVKWLDKIYPNDIDLKYSQQTGRLVWEIGDLPAATGVLLPVKEAVFQVSITPALANLGDYIELIGQSKITGRDKFTGENLSSADKAIDTKLPDDPQIGQKEGRVVQ